MPRSAAQLTAMSLEDPAAASIAAGRSSPLLRAEARGLTVWFTGLSGAGKTTLNHAVRDRLLQSGHRVESLDGDLLRQNLCKDLGFSKEDRNENVRRIGFVAHLLSRNGIIVLVSAISPYRALRDEVRA